MLFISLVLLASSSSSSSSSIPKCKPTYLKPPAVEDLSGITSHNFGRGGLSHLTVAGAIQTGTKDYELWMQTFVPGAATPIHSHDCDETFVVLKGRGEVLFLTDSGSPEPSRQAFGPNGTFSIPPRSVHQVVNTGSEDVQILVVLGRPPVQIWMYPSWAKGSRVLVKGGDRAEDEGRAGELIFPYFFDQTCLRGNLGNLGSGHKEDL